MIKQLQKLGGTGATNIHPLALGALLVALALIPLLSRKFVPVPFLFAG